jgi:tetratricopeptide (TPR) repeat protein
MPKAWAAGLIVAAGLAAYANSFTGPFVFDDLPSIRSNMAIRRFTTALQQPYGNGMTTSGRPIGDLSLALNYALSGTRVWSYHAFNLGIHLLAGLALFGVIRRTLLRCGAGSALPPDVIAFAAALLWTIHPLQTESVTYIVQRVESMMGLFYLLTLYCFIRYAEGGSGGGLAREGRAGRAPGARAWAALSVAACLLGMASKEVMVSAPLLAALYDRTFVSGSFREAWRRHRGVFLGLAATWLPLACEVAASGNRGGTAGYGVNVVWWRYALAQFPAIIHYLRLCFWPHPLVIDYGSDLSLPWETVLPAAVAVAALMAGVALALVRRPALGFLGAAFFAILAPTSSIVPIATETLAEHRMYLPLAPVAVLAVIALYRGLLAALSAERRAVPALLALTAVAAGALGIATERRNRDYSDAVTLWTVTAQDSPRNIRVLLILGYSLQSAGRFEDAVKEYEAVVRMQPDYRDVQEYLANCLFRLGRFRESVAPYEYAARAQPNSAKIRVSLGNALLELGRRTEAVDCFREALRLQPDLVDARYNLANVLSTMPGRLDEAIAQYREVLRRKPDFAEAHYRLGNAWNAEPGRVGDAIAEYEQAVRLKPDYAEARINLGNAYSNMPGRSTEAVAQFEAALRLNPDNAAARFDFGNALANIPGRMNDAIGQFEAALRLNPDYAEAHYNLAAALLSTGSRVDEARAHLEAFLRLRPDNEDARQILDRIRAYKP